MLWTSTFAVPMLRWIPVARLSRCWRRRVNLSGRRSSTANRRIEGDALRRPSPRWLRLFDRYLSALFLPRHFRAMRVAHTEQWHVSGRPLIVCLNHPSWWDPLVCIRLSRYLAPALEHYAPIDALAIARYGMLRSLGLFAVEQGTARGAQQFLRRAMEILRRPNAVLWLTPQGTFTDARERPVRFRSGLDALLRRVGPVTVLPLALEYTFWTERLPEALVLFGKPVLLSSGASEDAPGEMVAHALQQAQDELAALSIRRDVNAFQPVFVRAQGTGGIYGLWQSVRSALKGQGLRPEHSSLLRSATVQASHEEPR